MIGLIPTGWYPNSVSIVPGSNGSPAFAYVVTAKSAVTEAKSGACAGADQVGLEEFFVRIKSLQLLAWMALAGPALLGQSAALAGTQPPTNAATYWSATPPDCTSLAGESPVAIMSGATVVGYSCYVSGTFVWLAAGGGWVTSLSVAAPASGAIGVDYSFYNENGNSLKVDITPYNSPATTSTSDMSFALTANQPADIKVQGFTSSAPKYSSTATGTVYAVFCCPDARTCANVVPQLFYVSLPPVPWVLSAPIAWDTALWTQWSAQGIDDGGANRVSLVIYNEDRTVATYTVSVYDSRGALAGTGTTPPIPPLQFSGTDKNGHEILGEGGPHAALLSDLIQSPLPSGMFKILIDGGSNYSAVEVLQFSGPSATALQVAYDSAPNTRASVASARRAELRATRVASRPRPVFSPLVK